ncbi:MAG: hypothetical protein GWN55_04675, partial [Phycisphaerae bacterium]|nr:hypothetical protein [candidate division KSB1 bacterium]NIV00611.1 hypothetical protein [Phycisphaerae bacterium]NIS26059.1 hypothetical protein [candidate division KSB1 bacterium]NIT70930.1 hypothetical protein [candidate division KSB1 bacterium]NIU26705.1 hypothetical protein [candidate division KSB1 bacterium]
DALQNLEEELNDTDAKITALAEERALLARWQELAAPLGAGLATDRTQTLLFEGEKEACDALTNEL